MTEHKERRRLLEKFEIADYSGGAYAEGLFDGLKRAEKHYKELLTNEQLDKITELFCVVDLKPYPDGSGIWGMDTEIFSTDENKSGIQKAREAIREILEVGAKNDLSK